MGREKQKKKKDKKSKKKDKPFSVLSESSQERQERIFTPKYTDAIIFQIYSLVKSGMSENRITGSLGIAVTTYRKWIEKKPLVRLAIEEGKKLNAGKNAVQTFNAYVEETLPPDLHDLWVEINAFSEEKDATRKVTTLLATKGERVHQQLFLHALVDCNFNVSKAKMKVAVSQAKLMTWTKERDFARLLDHVNETKKDFFEGALLELVSKGDSTCVVFANKTYNRDRGYNEKIDINVQGSIDHNHNLIDISALDLPLDVKRLILKAARDERLLTENGAGIVPHATQIEEVSRG